MLGAGKDGVRLPRIAVLPFWSKMDNRRQRKAVVSASSCPEWSARQLPSFLIWVSATGCHPPRASTARGKKVRPYSNSNSNSIPSLVQSTFRFEHSKPFYAYGAPVIWNLRMQTKVQPGTAIVIYAVLHASVHVCGKYELCTGGHLPALWYCGGQTITHLTQYSALALTIL